MTRPQKINRKRIASFLRWGDEFYKFKQSEGLREWWRRRKELEVGVNDEQKIK
jgi:hypothetical protein